MRGFIFRFLLLFIFAILQKTLFADFHIVIDEKKIIVLQPDFILILTLYFSIKGGVMVGQISGFIGGVLNDVFTMKNFGLSMMIMTIVGFIMGQSHRRIFTDSVITIVIVTILATLLKGLLYIMIFYGFISNGNLNEILYFALYELCPELVFNTVFSILLFNILDKLNLSLEQEK